MKNLIYFILAITLLSVSCTKKDDGNVTPVTKTSGQLHPEYLGKWHCDSTFKDGALDLFDDVSRNYEFQDTKCIITDDQNPSMNAIFPKWELSGNTITLSDPDVMYTTVLTIVSPPANNKLVLIDNGFTEYLTKH
jgi:hypothetical protein